MFQTQFRDSLNSARDKQSCDLDYREIRTGKITSRRRCHGYLKSLMVLQ